MFGKLDKDDFILIQIDDVGKSYVCIVIQFQGEASTAEATEEEQSSPPAVSLNELAVSEHGLINDDFRRRAWPRLADLNIYETCLLPTQEEVESHKSYQQVVLDVSESSHFVLGFHTLRKTLLTTLIFVIVGQPFTETLPARYQ